MKIKINEEIKFFFRKLLPSIFSSGVTQINILVGTIIASFQAGAVSYLYYADRVYQINLAVAGIAIGTVMLPHLSKYIKNNIDTVVVGGIEYGSGSSRDWAAKGTKLLGIKAVIAESFERIHRSNLVGMGVLPLQFKEGFDRKKLNIKGSELFTIIDIEKGVEPRQEVDCEIKYADGASKKIKLLCRIDTANEIEYYKNGGILQYVLRNIL